MIERRFWEKVDKKGTWWIPRNHRRRSRCWLWTAGTNGNGYGRFRVGKNKKAAHVWAWEQANGPVPRGLVLDHLCRTPLCVRASHLEAVSSKVNTNRGRRFQSEKEQCIRGHDFDERNTYIFRNGRYCRACRAAAQLAYMARRLPL